MRTGLRADLLSESLKRFCDPFSDKDSSVVGHQGLPFLPPVIRSAACMWSNGSSRPIIKVCH